MLTAITPCIHGAGELQQGYAREGVDLVRGASRGLPGEATMHLRAEGQGWKENGLSIWTDWLRIPQGGRVERRRQAG